jgi:hypothetical protein
MSFFTDLARVLSHNRHLKINATKTAVLVNMPVTSTRRQTVKITAHRVRGAKAEVTAARVVSRAGFLEGHQLVRKALEFNAGKQRVSLILSGDSDPPALDAMLCIPIDVYDEEVYKKIWRVMGEVASVADNLERQLNGDDEL